jgi:hypothetical protein
VEKATVEAEKHGDRSEKLSALVAEARGMIEKAKTEKAERARAAAEEAEAAAAVKAAEEAEAAAERLQIEQEAAALTLVMQSTAMRLQQVQAQLGSSVVPPAAPHSDAEETQCVVCMDAPRNRVVLPCMHMCVCEACAQLLLPDDGRGFGGSSEPPPCAHLPGPPLLPNGDVAGVQDL